MKERIISFLLSLTIIFSGMSSYASDIGIMERVQTRVASIEEQDSFEKLFDFDELNIYKSDDVHMLPIRPILERLGYEIKWNVDLKQVDISKDLITTSIKPGENYYFSHKTPVKLSKAPEIKAGVTYVPLDFFKTILGEPLTIAGSSIGIFKRETVILEKESLELEGYIKDKLDSEDNQSILISVDKADLNLGELSLHIVDETEILDSKGEKISFEDLNVGDRLEIETPRYMTMSLPPQTTARRIVREEFLNLQSDKKVVDERELSYPVLKYGGNKVVESLFNQRIDEYISSLANNDLFFDLKLDYNISLINKGLVSIIFRGSFTHMGKEKELIKVLNVDLKNGSEINFENYFKEDDSSQKELNRMINSLVRKNYNMEFEAEEVFLYFKENHLVLYYYELDDSAVIPVEVYLDYEKIKDLIK